MTCQRTRATEDHVAPVITKAVADQETTHHELKDTTTDADHVTAAVALAVHHHPSKVKDPETPPADLTTVNARA